VRYSGDFKGVLRLVRSLNLRERRRCPLLVMYFGVIGFCRRWVIKISCWAGWLPGRLA